MTESLFKKLCCPVDKSELDLQVFKKSGDGEIAEGIMTCSQCQRYYPIIYGVPIMTPDEYREKALEAPVLNRWELSGGKIHSEKFIIQTSGHPASLESGENNSEGKVST